MTKQSFKDECDINTIVKRFGLGVVPVPEGTYAWTNAVFGYQERWAEMRYFPTLVTGGFRSTTANMIDP